jgi:hypothetical protein
MPKEEIANVNLDDLANEEVDETEETEEVEDTEETAEEEAADDTEEKSEEEASEETPPEEEEFTEDFREWASQYGDLPEGIKSDEDLIKSYLSTLPEMKRQQSDAQRLREVDKALRDQGFSGGVSDVLEQRRPAPSESGESYFPKKAASSFVETMVKEGRLEGDNAQSYKAIASFMDQVNAPLFDKIEQVFTTAMKGMVDNRKMMRDLLWERLPEGVQKGVSRSEVETLLDRGLFTSPEEAIRYLSFNKPEVMNALTRKAEQRGQEKARKKLRRNYAIRRTKTPAKRQPTYDYEKFKRPDGQWDEDKIVKVMGPDKGLKMLEAWDAENK